MKLKLKHGSVLLSLQWDAFLALWYQNTRPHKIPGWQPLISPPLSVCPLILSFDKLFYNFDLFMAVLGLCSCVGFPLVAVSRGYSSGNAWAFHCGGFSFCRAQALKAHGLQLLLCMVSVVGAPGLCCTGSVVAAHGLSCSAVCGSFLDQKTNPCLLRWQVDSLPLSYQGSLVCLFIEYILSFYFRHRTTGPITKRPSRDQVIS